MVSQMIHKSKMFACVNMQEDLMVCKLPPHTVDVEIYIRSAEGTHFYREALTRSHFYSFFFYIYLFYSHNNPLHFYSHNNPLHFIHRLFKKEHILLGTHLFIYQTSQKCKHISLHKFTRKCVPMWRIHFTATKSTVYHW